MTREVKKSNSSTHMQRLPHMTSKPVLFALLVFLTVSARSIPTKYISTSTSPKRLLNTLTADNHNAQTPFKTATLGRTCIHTKTTSIHSKNKKTIAQTTICGKKWLHHITLESVWNPSSREVENTSISYSAHAAVVIQCQYDSANQRNRNQNRSPGGKT